MVMDKNLFGEIVVNRSKSNIQVHLSEDSNGILIHALLIIDDIIKMCSKSDKSEIFGTNLL